MADGFGVDGCKGGWVVVGHGVATKYASFAALLALLPSDAVIAIDIPIGLADTYETGGRSCDRAARAILRTAVFPAPVRGALGVRTLEEANERGWPATKQSLGILPKIEDGDATIMPHLQARVFEVHPELAFWAMNQEQWLANSKHDVFGRKQRVELLKSNGVVVPARPPGVAEDDLLDACAARWTAQRILADVAVTLPDVPPIDSRGLRMEIWY